MKHMPVIKKRHRPIHLFLDKQIYFITSSIYRRRRLFDGDSKKAKLRSIIAQAADKYGISVFAWAILDDHYHLLVELPKGVDLPGFMKAINGRSSIWLNKEDGTPGRKVWHSYWDFCVRKEEDFWRRFNYIHINPVKHGYCEAMEEYRFSSFNQWADKQGAEWAKWVMAEYDIDGYSIEEERGGPD